MVLSEWVLVSVSLLVVIAASKALLLLCNQAPTRHTIYLTLSLSSLWALGEKRAPTYPSLYFPFTILTTVYGFTSTNRKIFCSFYSRAFNHIYTTSFHFINSICLFDKKNNLLLNK